MRRILQRKERLQKAYPHVDEFFATKKIYDRDKLFTDKFYEKIRQAASSEPFANPVQRFAHRHLRL